jgi:hypothetical protein
MKGLPEEKTGISWLMRWVMVIAKIRFWCRPKGKCGYRHVWFLKSNICIKGVLG